MRIQKTYIGYCIFSWVMWVSIFVLTNFSGNAFYIRNEGLYNFTYHLSGIATLVSLIPIHPILFVISLVYSIRNQEESYASFNVGSIVITTILAFGLIISRTWLVGGV